MTPARWLGCLLTLASCGPSPGPAAPAPARSVTDLGETQAPAGAGARVLPPAPSSSEGVAPAANSAPAPAEGVVGDRPWLKVQLHVHTGRSYDAATPPAEVASFYEAHGYDVLVITDHNRVTTWPSSERLLVAPGIEITQNAVECKPPPRGGYRCLFHTGGLFVDASRDARHGEVIAVPFQEERLAAYRGQVAQILALGGVPVLNHPLFHFAADARLTATLAREGVSLVELFDAGLDEQHPEGILDAQTRAEALWNDVLDSGATMYALATDDAHHFSDAPRRRKAGKHAYIGDRAWVRVHAARDVADLRAALVRGDFYGSTGVELQRLSVRADEIALEVAPTSGMTFSTRFVRAGGAVAARSEGEHARYVPRGDERWIRAVVERSDGARAWIQPLRLESSR